MFRSTESFATPALESATPAVDPPPTPSEMDLMWMDAKIEEINNELAKFAADLAELSYVDLDFMDGNKLPSDVRSSFKAWEA